MTYAYTWNFGGAPSARNELTGRMTPWLRNACKERGIPVTGKKKHDLIDALVNWAQKEDER